MVTRPQMPHLGRMGKHKNIDRTEYKNVATMKSDEAKLFVDPEDISSAEQKYKKHRSERLQKLRHILDTRIKQ